MFVLLLLRKNLARSGIVGGGPMMFSLFAMSATGGAAGARRGMLTCRCIFSLIRAGNWRVRSRLPAADVVPVVEVTLTLFPEAAIYAPDAR